MNVEVESLPDVNTMPDLNVQRLSGEFCDVLICSEDGGNFNAHKCVLAARSQYFRQMIQTSYKEAILSRIELKESRKVVEEMLNYIYNGQVTVGEATSVDLLRVADHYGLIKLFHAMEQHIAENLDTENVIDLAVEARILNAKFLREKVMNFLIDKFVCIPRTEEIEDEEMTAIIERGRQEDNDFMTKIVIWFKTKNKPDILLKLVESLELKKLSKNSLRLVIEACLENNTCHKILSEKLLDSYAAETKIVAQGKEYRFKRVAKYEISQVGIQECTDNKTPSDFVRLLPDGSLRVGGESYAKLGGTTLVISSDEDGVWRYTCFDFSTGLGLILPPPSQSSIIGLYKLQSDLPCEGSILKVGKIVHLSRFEAKQNPDTVCHTNVGKFKVTQSSVILRVEIADISSVGSEQYAIFMREIDNGSGLLKECTFLRTDKSVEVQFPFEYGKSYGISISMLD